MYDYYSRADCDGACTVSIFSISYVSYFGSVRLSLFSVLLYLKERGGEHWYNSYHVVTKYYRHCIALFF